MKPPSTENGQPLSRFSARLNLAQFILYVCIVFLGSGYFLLTLLDNAGFWIPLTRLLLATAFLTLGFIENALRMNRPPSVEETPDAPLPRPRWLPAFPARLRDGLLYVQQHLVTTTVTASLAFAFALMNLTHWQPGLAPESGRLLAFSVLLILCFALLVIERMLSFRRLHAWREQHEFIGLARVILSTMLLSAVALLIATVSLLAANALIMLASLVILLIALEYLVRVIAAMSTSPVVNTPHFLTRSWLAAQYRWPPRPLAFFLSVIHQRFGIDLRQIQAFRIMAARFTPVVSGIALLGWLLSGLQQIPLQQRGIYERFGQPVAVLQPGLHIGLPWPFGRVLPVENGAVHELQLSDVTEQRNRFPEPDTAEGPAPQSSWRLWDNSHATDQSQVIASDASGSQSFQIVNMDIRLIWRVGLKDQDALNSQYQTARLPEVIRSIARQVLVAGFASKQLDSLLNEQRSTLALALNQHIQQRLDALNSGVELLFTRIEAIHPPAGAADAYHGVQAAQIAASASIARQKGYAARVTSAAQRKALADINNAQAFAHENLARATAAATQFAAEHDAWRQAGSAFITERRYAMLRHSLAQTPLLLIDSHLQGTNEPVLDLRQYPSLPDSTASQKANSK